MPWMQNIGLKSLIYICKTTLKLHLGHEYQIWEEKAKCYIFHHNIRLRKALISEQRKAAAELIFENAQSTFKMCLKTDYTYSGFERR